MKHWRGIALVAIFLFASYSMTLGQSISWEITVNPPSGPPGSSFKVTTGVNATCIASGVTTSGEAFNPSASGTEMNFGTPSDAEPGNVSISCEYDGQTKTAGFTVTSPPPTDTPGPPCAGCPTPEPPTVTPDGSKTATPQPLTLTPPGNCFVSAKSGGGANIRAEPTTSSADIGHVIYGEWRKVDRATDAEGFTWYFVIDGGGWVRSDVITLAGPCPFQTIECTGYNDQIANLPPYLVDGASCDELIDMIENDETDIIIEYVPEVEALRDDCPTYLPEFITLLYQIYDLDDGDLILSTINDALSGLDPDAACAFIKQIISQEGLPDGFPDSYSIEVIAYACNRSITTERYKELIAQLQAFDISLSDVKAETACQLLNAMNQVGGISDEQKPLYDQVLRCEGKQPIDGFEVVVFAVASNLPLDQVLNAIAANREAFCDNPAVFIVGAVTSGALPENYPQQLIDANCLPFVGMLFLNHLDTLTDDQEYRILNSPNPCEAVNNYINSGIIPTLVPISTPTPTRGSVTPSHTPTGRTLTATHTPSLTETASPTELSATFTQTNVATATSTATVTPATLETPTPEISPTVEESPTNTLTATSTSSATAVIVTARDNLDLTQTPINQTIATATAATPTPTSPSVTATLTPQEQLENIRRVLKPKSASGIGVLRVVANGSDNGDLYILREGEGVRITTTADIDEFLPALDAQGNRIAYLQRSSDGVALRVVKLTHSKTPGDPVIDDNSGTLTISDLGDGLMFAEYPLAWSPKGDLLLLTLKDIEGKLLIYELRLASTSIQLSERRLEEVVEGYNAEYSPNARYIVFVRENDVYIRTNLNTILSELTDEDFEGRGCFNPSFASASYNIYFVCTDGETTETTDTRTLYLYDTSGIIMRQESFNCPYPIPGPERNYYAVCNGESVFFARSEDIATIKISDELETELMPELEGIITDFNWRQYPGN